MHVVEREIVIRAPASDVYQVWHNFENLPMFMGNVKEVHMTDPRHSHWKARGPLWTRAEWDAEIIDDNPGHAIAWRSIEGSGNVRTAGRVDFTETDGATRLHIELAYEPPGGTVGEFLSRIFANPEHQVETDLQRFKEGVERGQQFETGSPPARPNVGHGTPGGTLGSLNETDNRAEERTSEKSDNRPT